MKKIFLMIAAVAMAAVVTTSCKKGGESADKADSTKVEAKADAAPAADKPVADQIKDALSAVKEACDKEDLAALETSMMAYADALGKVASPKELDELMSNPELDIEKALKNAKDPETWADKAELEKLGAKFKPALEKAIENVVKGQIGAAAAEEAPAEEPAK